ncbi:MAG: methyltransferase domain-containing protein [Cyclobacteriaceae bacterium]|nr:methyltransferase domain-containing protein [Cyclobacteriaceae bacterium]MCH8516621.1 methyltransferase domain-containing protein [Cyclobacteriaceae bacterium]
MSSFQFKQFLIRQDQSAMRVSTDACVLGAWVNNPFYHEPLLDIGTGTGLLALMLAQKGFKDIHAIDIDKDSLKDAEKNVQSSIFKDQINLHHQDINELCHHPSQNKKYKTIISNPPFFENQYRMKAENHQRARHSSNLKRSELAKAIALLLKNDGMCFLLLPKREMEIMLVEMQQQGLFPKRKLSIRDREDKAIKREIVQFGFEKNGNVKEELLTLKGAEGQYSPEFIMLLKPYYLYL